ncbi:MAG: hypothetical protein E7322_07490 [Clostridiales bacterium]|nr:hypothetical protein [Clostridiales bacterium]
MDYEHFSEPGAHEGHRERLKSRAWEDGLLSLPAHEVIELLLYYVFPRQNVNELAHQLIKRFGSIKGVLDASYDDLFSIMGVGHSVATALNAFGRAARAYAEVPREIAPVILNRSDAIRYASSLFEHDRRAQTWIALVNSGGVIAFSGRVFTGNMWYNDRVRRYIVERVLAYNAHEVIVISRRGLDTPKPFDLDLRSLVDLSEALKMISAYILDYIIIGKTKNVSMRQVADIGNSRWEDQEKSFFMNESEEILEIHELSEIMDV